MHLFPQQSFSWDGKHYSRRIIFKEDWLAMIHSHQIRETRKEYSHRLPFWLDIRGETGLFANNTPRKGIPSILVSMVYPWGKLSVILALNVFLPWWLCSWFIPKFSLPANRAVFSYPFKSSIHINIDTKLFENRTWFPSCTSSVSPSMQKCHQLCNFVASLQIIITFYKQLFEYLVTKY